MKPNIQELISEIAITKQKLDGDEKALDRIRRLCQHTWAPVKYDPIIRGGYQDPGDPVGTMGIDRRLPVYIPRHETPRWTRECLECGIIQETTRTKEQVTNIPVF